MATPKQSSVFPKNFLWGTATSAHQVEGNNHNDWTEWEKLGLVKNGEQSGRAAGHYERFREDFALAKDLGHNAHRFSIEWSRVFPKPGQLDEQALDHYRQVLEELRRHKIEPIVTLHHFTNPIWIARAGGWTSRRTVDWFGQYVLAIIKTLGPLANYWVTVNEPTVYTSLTYISGLWPPQKKSYAAAWLAIRHLAEAHRLAYQIIKRHFPDHKVGVANNISDFVPARPANPLDRALQRFAHYWHNQWWLDQTYLTQDFLGLNYYFHHPLQFRPTRVTDLFAPAARGDKPINDLGWEIHPQGFGRVLDWLGHYRRPIIITENGLADAKDLHRSGFILQHVHQLQAAVQRGLDIRGYLHWSLLDNFEWREGFTPRFGLVEVDYHTLKRTPRPSANVFREICRKNGL